MLKNKLFVSTVFVCFLSLISLSTFADNCPATFSQAQSEGWQLSSGQWSGVTAIYFSQVVLKHVFLERMGESICYYNSAIIKKNGWYKPVISNNWKNTSFRYGYSNTCQQSGQPGSNVCSFTLS